MVYFKERFHSEHLKIHNESRTIGQQECVVFLRLQLNKYSLMIPIKSLTTNANNQDFLKCSIIHMLKKQYFGLFF